MTKSLNRYKENKTSTQKDFDYLKSMEEYFNNGVGTTIEKLVNFPKYVPRQNLTYFLSKYEIFKKILNVNGSIIECGVLAGGGLMTFLQLSAIFEPVNHTRKVIGFDTFSGFPNLTKEDKGSISQFVKKRGLSLPRGSYEDLKKCLELYDMNRFLNHIPKAELIRGDVSKTIPEYLKKNPHLIVSLLYLDFDLYKPTKIALENFVPRMPKGSIIVFDELNSKEFVGETRAVLTTLDIRNLKIQRFPFNTYMSYVILD